MEPGTGLTILGGAVGSAKLVEKLLGPTAEYLGEGLRQWTEKRVENIGRIFQSAARFLGDEVDKPGAVPPKVLKGILDEGSFCDDQLSAEYFGGVLASARTDVPRDDRGAALIALLGRLTTYQIRSHFIFYHVVKSLFDGQDINIADDSRQRLATFIPFSVYISAMAFTSTEDVNTIMSHVMFGLARERLIEDAFRLGPLEYIKRSCPGATEDGIVYSPSALGAELFLWCYGKGRTHIEEFLLKATYLKNEQIEIPPGSEPVFKPNAQDRAAGG